MATTSQALGLPSNEKDSGGHTYLRLAQANQSRTQAFPAAQHRNAHPQPNKLKAASWSPQPAHLVQRLGPAGHVLVLCRYHERLLLLPAAAQQRRRLLAAAALQPAAHRRRQWVAGVGR